MALQIRTPPNTLCPPRLASKGRARVRALSLGNEARLQRTCWRSPRGEVSSPLRSAGRRPPAASDGDPWSITNDITWQLSAPTTKTWGPDPQSPVSPPRSPVASRRGDKAWSSGLGGSVRRNRLRGRVRCFQARVELRRSDPDPSRRGDFHHPVQSWHDYERDRSTRRASDVGRSLQRWPSRAVAPSAFGVIEPNGGGH